MPVSDFANRLKRLVFPPVCAACEMQMLPEEDCPGIVEQRTELSNEFPSEHSGSNPVAGLHEKVPFCESCLSAMLPPNPLDLCQKCGAFHNGRNPFPGRCRLCFDLDLRFDRAIAVGNYQGILQSVVIKAKQRQHDALAFQLGRLLGVTLERFDVIDGVDLIVPVPTHWTRRLQRGFHGSAVIAEGVSRMTGIPNSEKTIFAKRRTRKQGMLSGNGRRENVRNAFDVHKRKSVKGLTVLIIDDVMTSGATVSEVARTLIRAGAGRVLAGVGARGAGVS